MHEQHKKSPSSIPLVEYGLVLVRAGAHEEILRAVHHEGLPTAGVLRRAHSFKGGLSLSERSVLGKGLA